MHICNVKKNSKNIHYFFANYTVQLLHFTAQENLTKLEIHSLEQDICPTATVTFYSNQSLLANSQ